MEPLILLFGCYLLILKQTWKNCFGTPCKHRKRMMNGLAPRQILLLIEIVVLGKSGGFLQVCPLLCPFVYETGFVAARIPLMSCVSQS